MIILSDKAIEQVVHACGDTTVCVRYSRPIVVHIVGVCVERTVSIALRYLAIKRVVHIGRAICVVVDLADQP